jgi:hypothetical protein
MIKKTLIFLVGFALLAVPAWGRRANLPTVTDRSLVASQFAGDYNAEWVAKPTGLGWVDGESQHVGTWDISIASDGDVKGTEFDKTGGDKGTISGFIDDDGYIKVFVKYETTVTIKGVLEKRGIRLTGTLKQTCSSGSVCASIEMILKRKEK